MLFAISKLSTGGLRRWNAVRVPLQHFVRTSVLPLSSTPVSQPRSVYRHYSRVSYVRMSPNFASSDYTAAFADLPVPDTDTLRASALEYLDAFDPKTWYNDPITTILNGAKLPGAVENLQDTRDAFGDSNGRQYLASPEQIEALKEHITTYQSPYRDLRPQIRRIEQRLLGEYAGFLIGNQSMDFGKQDGVTEIEEAIMANAVERKLNDNLFQDELDGKVTIVRKPAYVAPVSNFTNFLDLFRKTIRNLELGVPCVVLGRSNTVQHSYRWTELLVDLLREEKVQDLGMLTYLSCSLDDIKDITRTCRDFTGNLYATCSRALAADMVSGYPNTVASTGGPNTLLTTEWTDSVQEAIRMSAAIECAGQCTALRHCVVPESVGASEVQKIFAGAKSITSGPEGLKKSMFDCVFAEHKGSSAPPEDMYTHDTHADAYFKVGKHLPESGIEEYWRKVVVDFSQLAPGKDWKENEAELFSLATWLNENQPISLAVNSRFSAMVELGKHLFETTGLVVYTFGSTNNPDAPPALTCQARPQEAEVFGEFPPRHSLRKYTRWPVMVPSSTPSYDSHYTLEYLKTVKEPHSLPESVNDLLNCVKDKTIRGYCHELLNYLADATHENPKRGFGTSRTALWGLQRPPLLKGVKTCIRFAKGVSLDDLAPVLLLFYATNARDQMELSIHPDNHDVLKICRNHSLPVVIHTDEEQVECRKRAYNVVDSRGPMTHFPLVGQFVSLYFPLGHVKSTMKNDDLFVSRMMRSKKWLKMHE